MKTRTLVTIATVWYSFCPPAHAQWIRTNGPYGNVYCLAASDTNLFAGSSSGGGVFRSTSSGQGWIQVNTGLANTHVGAVAFSGTNRFAGTDGGVFLSTNNGTNWTVAGLTNVSPQALAVFDTSLFAGTYQSGVFLSTDNGTSWSAVNTGLTGTSLYIVALFVSPNGASGTNLFAGTWGGGAFLSTNHGTSWTAKDSGLTSNLVHAFTIFGTNLFAGTYGSGVFRSTNNGTSWTEASNGLTNSNVRALALSPNGASGTNLFAGTDGGGVFLSTNNGTSWTAVNTDLTNTVVNALTVSGTNLFAGTGDGVWRRPLSDMITSAAEIAGGELPWSFELGQNYPNPFNPSTRIQFRVASFARLPSPSNQGGQGFVSLKVYDLLGREVKTLVNEEMKVGSYETTFDAHGLASGVYYYTLRAGNLAATKKLLLLR